MKFNIKKWRLEHKEHRQKYSKKYREENKEKIKKLQRNWYLKHREESIKRNKEWIKLHPDKKRNNDLKSLFGITLDQYKEMLKEQNGVCAICGKKETEIDNRTNKKRNLAVDHDHKSEKIRGLLCGKCNKMLGLVNDNINILLSAINYLNKDK